MKNIKNFAFTINLLIYSRFCCSSNFIRNNAAAVSLTCHATWKEIIKKGLHIYFIYASPTENKIYYFVYIYIYIQYARDKFILSDKQQRRMIYSFPGYPEKSM